MADVLSDKDFEGTAPPLTDSDFAGGPASVMAPLAKPVPAPEKITRGFEQYQAQFKPTAEKVRRIGPAVAGLAAGPIGEQIGEIGGVAAGLGERGIAMARTIGGALGFTGAPIAAAKLTGLPTPSLAEDAKGFGINLAFGTLGEPFLKPGEYAPERAVTEAARTRTPSAARAVRTQREAQSVNAQYEAEKAAAAAADEKAALDVREQAFRSAGHSEAEVAAWRKDAETILSKGKELRANLGQIERVNDQQFGARYNEVLGTYGKGAGDAESVIGKIQETQAKLARTGQVTPKTSGTVTRVAEYLKKTQGRDILFTTPDGEIGKVPSGAVAVGMDSGEFLFKLPNGNVMGIPQEQMLTGVPSSAENLWKMRVAVRKGLRSGSATDADKLLLGETERALTSSIESGMRAAGANEETLGKFRDLDTEYGDYMSTLRTFSDAWKGRATPEQTADSLFRIGEKDPSQLTVLMKYAKKADEVDPRVMPALRDAFMTRVQRVSGAEVGPVSQLAKTKAIAETFGRETPQVMEAIFPPGSPFRDPSALASATTQVADPRVGAKMQETLEKAVLKDAGSRSGRSFLSSPYFRFMAGFALVTGKSIWGAMFGGKPMDPTVLAAGVGAGLASSTGLGWAMNKLNAAQQRAVYEWMTRPGDAVAADRFIRSVGSLTADAFSGIGGGPTPPSPEQATR